MNLAGRVALVTGGHSGIGLATVEALAAQGAHVVCLDVTEPAVAGAGVEHVHADLRDPATPDAVVTDVLARHGRVDILVNNVGLAPYRSGFVAVSDADWTALFEINVMSMVRMCRAVIPAMSAGGRGAIVSLASDAARAPDPFFVDYAMTKACVLSVSKALSKELGPLGIRVNTVSPGPTATPALIGEHGMAADLARTLGVTRQEAVEHFVHEMRRLPLGRLVDPGDVAATICFLVSDASASTTGADLAVNAGSLTGV